MDCFCCRNRLSDRAKEFTILLVHVIGVSHPSALQGSSNYAQGLVEQLFSKYTTIDTRLIEEHHNKFVSLQAGSRLDIAFAGRPNRHFQVPARKVYIYEHSEGLEVIFEVDVRLLTRFIPPGYDYSILEIERTDYVPQYWMTCDFSVGSRVSMRS